MAMQNIILIVHNVRSAHNVGSILRTADGLGVAKVYLSGYTPYPSGPGDIRLPHLAAKNSRQIHKTALGAEDLVVWNYEPDVKKLLNELKMKDYTLIALEQTDKAIDLRTLKPVEKIALVVGSEVGGLPQDVLDLCDKHIHIPMSGKKESFSVAIAAAIALYQLRNLS